MKSIATGPHPCLSSPRFLTETAQRNEEWVLRKAGPKMRSQDSVFPGLVVCVQKFLRIFSVGRVLSNQCLRSGSSCRCAVMLEFSRVFLRDIEWGQL